MLRRVARVLRILLFVLGVVILVWMPFSTFALAFMDSPWPGSGCLVDSHYGVLRVRMLGDPDVFHGPLQWGITSPTLHDWGHRGVDPMALALYRGTGTVSLYLPLWLLAFLCLAWPVTSFIVGRRRRKGRGFEVEAKPGAAVPPPD